MSEFVLIPENPAPEFAEIFYFEDADHNKMRGMFARAASQYGTPRGTVIISPGRTECVEKYFEVARDLQKRGFCVVAFDWPGQGLSYRLLPDRLAGHIYHFDTFVAALRHGLNAIEHKLFGPRVVLGHSMGGAIVLEALRQQVLDVEAAAFSSPMWGLKIAKILHPLAPLMCKIGFAKKIVYAHKLDDEFEGNILSNNQERWRIAPELVKVDSNLALGAVTWGWVNASLKVAKGFTLPNVLDHLDMPILVASAQNEELVDNKSHTFLAKRMKSAHHIEVSGAKHEILMENDNRRDRFFKEFDKMLDRAGI